jgi:hypothetical protein
MQLAVEEMLYLTSGDLVFCNVMWCIIPLVGSESRKTVLSKKKSHGITIQTNSVKEEAGRRSTTQEIPRFFFYNKMND